MKTLIFGTGTAYQRFKNSSVLDNSDVVALVDNDSNKQGQIFDGKLVISPDKILNLKYDYIVITSKFFPEISKQLTGMDIPRDKILSRGEYLLKKRSFSIVADDCWGGSVYKDLGLRHNSPFTWTAIDNPDFFRLMRNLGHYLNCQLRFSSSLYSYPIGMLDDIVIRFVHCRDEKEAELKWYNRISRFDWNNLDYVFYKSSITDYKHAEEFDKIAVKNKIAFTDQDYGFNSCIWIKNWETEKGKKYKENEFGMYVLESYNEYFDVLKWLDGQPDFRK